MDKEHEPEKTDKAGTTKRRHLLSLFGGLGALGWFSSSKAHHTDSHFGDRSEHQVVYQCNKADIEYMEHILFSVGEILRLYSDEAEIIVECFGPGIQLLGLRPTRHIPRNLQQKARSLSEYGVAFRACGNTMKSLSWAKKDLVDYAKIVPVGAADLIKLQEKGFAYISW